jgi:hypothetical protein
VVQRLTHTLTRLKAFYDVRSYIIGDAATFRRRPRNPPEDRADIVRDFPW